MAWVVKCVGVVCVELCWKTRVPGGKVEGNVGSLVEERLVALVITCLVGKGGSVMVGAGGLLLLYLGCEGKCWVGVGPWHRGHRALGASARWRGRDWCCSCEGVGWLVAMRLGRFGEGVAFQWELHWW